MGLMKKFLDFLKDWRNQRSYFVWLLMYSIPYIPKIVLMMVLGLVDTILSVGLAIILKRIIDGASSGGIVMEAILLYLG
jgi:ABC-type multidrug transport system fused ATPase/permease subunit